MRATRLLTEHPNLKWIMCCLSAILLSHGTAYAATPLDAHFSDSVLVSDSLKLGNNPPSQDGQVNGITSMEWAPDGQNRLYVTIKGRAKGNAIIQVIRNGAVQNVPFYTFNDGVETHNECGLMSLAFHPEYAKGTKQIYCFITVSPKEQQIVRFDEIVDAQGNFVAAGPPTPVVKGIPTNGEIHNGGAVVVAPDQNGKGHFLYWSCGNNGIDRGAKLDHSNLGSKIGRANMDGSIPNDGLNQSGYVWAYGYRNPFTMAVQPGTGRIWVSVVGEFYEQIFMPTAGSWAGDKDYEAGGAGAGPGGPKDPELLKRRILPMYKYRTGGTDTRQLAESNSASRKDNVVTFTTTTPHRFLKGEKITISSVSPGSFNGSVYVLNTPSEIAFTAEMPGTELTGSGGTAVTQNVGNCITGGGFNDKKTWPKEFEGNYFFGDYASGRISRMQFNADNTVKQVDTFLTGGGAVIDISFGPDGNLYYAIIDKGEIHKVIYSALVIGNDTKLPATTAGVKYNQRLSAAGGAGALKWSVASGALPPGMTLGADGVLSGSATAAGAFRFVAAVEADDKKSGRKELTLAVSPEPSIATRELPGGRLGFAYHQILKFRDGLSPRSWSVVSGALPEGVHLDAAKGTLIGRPTQKGTAHFAIELKDAAGAVNRRDYTVEIQDGTAAPKVTMNELPPANVGWPYSPHIQVDAYPLPTYELIKAPAGMTLDAKTGLLKWTPKEIGKFEVAIKAANGIEPAVERSFSLDVQAYGLVERPLAKPFLGLDPAALPATLSKTGVFIDMAALKPAPALIAYTVNSPLWSDGSSKQRWISIPAVANEVPEKINFEPTGEWKFPVGTVMVKTFDLKTDEHDATTNRRLETRLLFVQPEGVVVGATYKWRADKSDADIVIDGADEDFKVSDGSGNTRTQRWHFPSRAECLQCHTTNAGGVLGIKTRQLNGDLTFPGTGVRDNQLRSWSHAGILDKPLDDAAIAALPRLVSVHDAAAPLESRVRSYIDANCANCHRPGGAPAIFDARFDTPALNQNIVNGNVNQDLGVKGIKTVLARDLKHSSLSLRAHSTDPAVKMPPLTRNVVDAGAVAVIDEWINSLPDGKGLSAEYFGTPDLQEPKLSRIDATVDFDWGQNAPDAKLDAKRFSVRWSGDVMPQFTETYTFYTKSDDGARLWVNGQPIIEKWQNQGATEWSGTIALTAGKKVAIKMEYFQNGGDASAKLLWSSPSTPKATIPQGYLFPDSKEPPAPAPSK
jgi:uncharacterized repeat protein (TIGR03806 family)